MNGLCCKAKAKEIFEEIVVWAHKHDIILIEDCACPKCKMFRALKKKYI